MHWLTSALDREKNRAHQSRSEHRMVQRFTASNTVRQTGGTKRTKYTTNTDRHWHATKVGALCQSVANRWDAIKWLHLAPIDWSAAALEIAICQLCLSNADSLFRVTLYANRQGDLQTKLIESIFPIDDYDCCWCSRLVHMQNVSRDLLVIALNSNKSWPIEMWNGKSKLDRKWEYDAVAC